MPETQKRHYRGWQADRPDHRDRLLQVPFVRKLFLASQGDIGPKRPRVEDQQWVGSCVGNSTSSAFEFVAIKAGLPVEEMSRLFIYFATRVWIEKTPPSEDSGCQIRDAMKALAMFGCCHEKTWPYIPDKYSAAPTPAAITEAKRHLITQYWRCPSLRAVKVSILQGYPVVFGFTCFESLESDATTKTGIVPYPAAGEGSIGGHAVLATGFNDVTQLVKFENSWGPDWGDKGFGYLPYKYFTNGYANDCWTIRMATGV
jgi:C1A family cysteine protease